MNDYAITTVTPFLIASACTIGAVIFYALGVRVQPHRVNVREGGHLNRNVRKAAALLACSAGIALYGLALFVLA